MKRQCCRRQKSGQVLVITSLIIILLLFSSTLYVAETEKNSPISYVGGNISLLAFRSGTVHSVISALANISNGGSLDVLAEDLNQYKSIFLSHSYGSMITMDSTPLNVAPYQDGVWLSWDQNGFGISGISVDFTLNSTGLSKNQYAQHTVNVTSAISISGQYTPLNGSSKQTEVTVSVLNEGKPALAKNFTVYYEDDGSLSTEEWIQVTSPSVIDYGNGTYLLSFTAETTNPSDPLLVSVHSHDLRSVFVRANATCVQT